MNEEEVEKIIYILLQADTYCASCSASLISLFIESFPEFRGKCNFKMGTTFQTEVVICS